MGVRILSVLIGCVLLAAFCALAMAFGMSDKSSVGEQAGKVIIRSIPLKCKVFFLGKDIDKVEDQITIEGVPAGVHPIAFEYSGEKLNAEVGIQSGVTSLVNGSFSQLKAFITTQVHIGKDGAPMTLIPAGKFQMGNNEGEPDEIPVHEVYLDAFYMDMFEVTNALYRKFVDATGHEPPKYWDDPGYNASDQPVVGVVWNDAKAYCEWAGKRLPTEAEWEKAARGGLVEKTYPWGDDINRPVAGDPESGTTKFPAGGTLPVGSFDPNSYGLYNMDGNAWEWCSDWYGEEYYSQSPERNPKGPDSGDARVMRGGSWFADMNTPLPVSYRYSYNPSHTSNLIGFRCVAIP